MPDSAKLRSCFIDFAFKAQLVAQPVEEVNAAETRTNDKHVSLEVVGVRIRGSGNVGISGADVSTEMDHGDGRRKDESEQLGYQILKQDFSVAIANVNVENLRHPCPRLGLLIDPSLLILPVQDE